MFDVVFHVVKDGTIKAKRRPIERLFQNDFPQNITFITAEDKDFNNRFIFIIKNRANIRDRENLNVSKITIFGEDWEYTIPCGKAKAYIANIGLTKTMLQIMKETRSKELKKYLKRIDGYAEKKKIPCLDYYKANSN